MLLRIIRNKRLLILLFLAVVLVLLATVFKKDNLGIDLPSEGTNTDYSVEANIVDGEELLQQLKSLQTFQALSKDIRTFGKAAYETYSKDANKVVGFKVDKEIKKEGETLSFTGRYGDVSNKISLKVTLLNNRRFKVSITDTKTGLNFDQNLESNSRRNQFIGTLPVSADDYSIDFDSGSDSFVISLYPEEASGSVTASHNRATTKIKDALGLDSLDSENISIIRAGGSLAP